jgi:hypothetical protein
MAHHAARMASGRMMRPLGAVFLCLSLVLPPCTSPGLERTPHAGLGVSRAVLQAVFARPESAFICGAPHESRGVPSPGGNGTDAMVKVWGEASEAAGGESQPIALWAWSALVEVWRQGAEAPGSAGRLPLWGRRPWWWRGPGGGVGVGQRSVAEARPRLAPDGLSHTYIGYTPRRSAPAGLQLRLSRPGRRSHSPGEGRSPLRRPLPCRHCRRPRQSRPLPRCPRRSQGQRY